MFSILNDNVLFTLAALLVLVVLLVISFIGNKFVDNAMGEYHCLDCQSDDHVELKSRMHPGAFLLLLILGLFPGVIYFMYHRFDKQKVCKHCSSTKVISRSKYEENCKKILESA